MLAVRGEQAGSQELAARFQELLSEARERCTPLFTALREQQRQVREPAREQALRQRLNEAATLMTRLLPACGAMFALHAHLPQELVLEALAVLGSLDLVGSTEPGQQALRHALLDQDRGDWTFLNALPSLAPVLSQPPCLRLLEQGGLSPVSFKLGAALFLKRVATDMARALGDCVVSWSQKGHASAARTLLRTAISLQAPLYGLGPEGLEQALLLLEELRDRPGAQRGRRCAARLEALARKYPTPNRTGAIQALRPLVTGLAQRDPMSVALHLRARANTEGAPRLTGLEIAAVQTTLAKEQTAKRQALAASTGKGALETKRPESAKAPATPPVKRPPR